MFVARESKNDAVTLWSLRQYNQSGTSIHCIPIFFSYCCHVQNSTNTANVDEMESLRKECEAAKKKAKATLEKYFAESDRLKAIIDEMHGTCVDLKKS